MSRCLPSEMSIAIFCPSGENRGFAHCDLRRAQRRRLAVARHPVDGVARGSTHAAWHVRQRALRENVHLRAARTRRRHEPFDRRRGRAHRLEADGIEGHREERALLDVEEVAAFALARASARPARLAHSARSTHWGRRLSQGPPSPTRQSGRARRRCWPRRKLPIDALLRVEHAPCRREAPGASVASSLPD